MVFGPSDSKGYDVINRYIVGSSRKVRHKIDAMCELLRSVLGYFWVRTTVDCVCGDPQSCCVRTSLAMCAGCVLGCTWVFGY